MIASVAVSLAALLHGAELELAWGLRAEARTTSFGTELTTSGREWAPLRQQAVTVPRVATVLSAPDLRVMAEYQPRIWSSDLDAHPSPIVNHIASLMVENSRAGDRPVEVGLEVAGVRGYTDPIEDAIRAQAAGVTVSQLVSTTPLPFESLRTAARTRIADGQRDVLEGIASWGLSRSVYPGDRATLPVQREVAVQLRESHLVTERTTLALQARGARSVTDAVTGRATGDTVALTLTDRWRATPATELWAGGGAAFLRTTGPDARRELSPLGTLGVLTGSGTDLTASATVSATTMFDRFTGSAVPIFEGAASVRWTMRSPFVLAATVTGARRTDDVFALATTDLRVIWTVQPRTLLEVGTIGRWQRDYRAERTTFAEVGAFVGVTWASDLAAGRAQPTAQPGEGDQNNAQ